MSVFGCGGIYANENVKNSKQQLIVFTARLSMIAGRFEISRLSKTATL